MNLRPRPWTIYYDKTARSRWYHYLFWCFQFPYTVTSGTGWIETLASTKWGARRKLRRAQRRFEEEQSRPPRPPWWDDKAVIE